jgi:hypothetical protein
MRAAVVIAARGGLGAKSRCRGRLHGSQREALVEAMLLDMLQALAGCVAIHRVYVTTPTAALASLAARNGAVVILEHGPPDLNRAFSDAAAGSPRWLQPAWSPCCRATCRYWIRQNSRPASPSRRRAPSCSRRRPRRRHRRRGAARRPAPAVGVRSRQLPQTPAGRRLTWPRTPVIEAPSLGFDLDRPEDLDAVARLHDGRTAALLRKFAVAGEAAA